MRVLGIETSCDETAVALFDAKQGLLGHCLHSQAPMHAQYGGVVPELASRDHIRKLIPLLTQLLDASDTKPKDIDGVAYTAGPGLIGALLVGAAMGRSLAWAWGVPGIEVHHLEGHLLAPLLEENPPTPPFLALLVSGGHTQLIAVKKIGDYHLLGETLDDSAGEAFDKTAKLLGLGYPGGPAIAKLAETGQPERFHFPRPMTNRPGLDFSFSGLKTQVRTTFQAAPKDQQTCADIARCFEEAVVDTLIIKCRRALKQTGLPALIVAGGVGANQRLRQKMRTALTKLDVPVYYPRPEFCTDNAAMIAFAGYQRLLQGASSSLSFEVRPRWPLADL